MGHWVVQSCIQSLNIPFHVPWGSKHEPSRKNQKTTFFQKHQPLTRPPPDRAPDEIWRLVHGGGAFLILQCWFNLFGHIHVAVFFFFFKILTIGTGILLDRFWCQLFFLVQFLLVWTPLWSFKVKVVIGSFSFLQYCNCRPICTVQITPDVDPNYSVDDVISKLNGHVLQT